MELHNKDLNILDLALTKLKSGFFDFPDTLSDENEEVLKLALVEVAEKLHNNYPYFQPNYAGQMLKPPHAVARLAYRLALYINPNNHALDGSRASSPMEKECIDQLSGMFGWSEGLGHLTSSGTIANLEALWVAGMQHPGKLIVASELAHYTHRRITSVLGQPFMEVSATNKGKMDMRELERILSTGRVGTVVVTLGTTGTGSLDPLNEIVELRNKYNFRIHIDAAYGGYFVLSDVVSEMVKKEFNSVSNADSLVIDPHKHGLQPYGCGCILFKDANVGQLYKHDSPYTYFTSDDLHLGEISLECSRAGASAVALWTTMRVYPLIKGGEFAKSLNSCHKAAIKLSEKIKSDSNFILLFEPELDIVVWGIRADTASEMSKKAKILFEKAARRNLHLALINYPSRLLPAHWSEVVMDRPEVTLLRSCLMKESHLDFVDDMWNIIAEI